MDYKILILLEKFNSLDVRRQAFYAFTRQGSQVRTLYRPPRNLLQTIDYEFFRSFYFVGVRKVPEIIAV